MQSIKSLLANKLKKSHNHNDAEFKEESESEQSTNSLSFSSSFKFGGSARNLFSREKDPEPESFKKGPDGNGSQTGIATDRFASAPRKVHSAENLGHKRANTLNLKLHYAKNKIDLKKFSGNAAAGLDEKEFDESKKPVVGKKGKISVKDYLSVEIPEAVDVLKEQLPRITEKSDWDSQQDLFLKKVRACKAQLEFKTDIEIRSNSMEKFANLAEESKASFVSPSAAKGGKGSGKQGKGAALSKARIHTLSVSISEQHDENSQIKAMKKRKTEYLLEIAEFFSFAPLWFNLDNGKELISMVSVNIFRPLPPSHFEKLKINSTGKEIPFFDDPELSNTMFSDPAMVHLIPVYQIFHRIVSSADVDVAMLKKLISRQYVERLCENFLSEDKREREIVKSIVLKVYGKFNTYRTFIRKVFQNQFLECIYETDHHPGITEILDILASIVIGFAIPLRREHKHLLMSTIVPLVQCSQLPEFQNALVICLSEFVSKEPSFAKDILHGIISRWPVRNSTKQVAFVELLDSILQVTSPENFKAVIPFVFPMIAKCICSCNVPVVERTLLLWNQEYICQLIFANRQQILPIVFGPIHENSQHHWAVTIRTLSDHVIYAFREVDKKLFNMCKEDYVKKTKTKT